MNPFILRLQTQSRGQIIGSVFVIGSSASSSLSSSSSSIQMFKLVVVELNLLIFVSIKFLPSSSLSLSPSSTSSSRSSASLINFKFGSVMFFGTSVIAGAAVVGVVTGGLLVLDAIEIRVRRNEQHYLRTLLYSSNILTVRYHFLWKINFRVFLFLSRYQNLNVY